MYYLFISSGWSHAWHFDESPFSTTIMLQTAEDGGYFDYTRPIRGGRGGGDKNNKKVRCFMKKIVFENSPKKSHIISGVKMGLFVAHFLTLCCM